MKNWVIPAALFAALGTFLMVNPLGLAAGGAELSCLYGLEGVLFLWTAFAWWEWFAFTRNELTARAKEAEYKLTPQYMGEIISRMGDRQLAAFSRMGAPAWEIVPADAEGGEPLEYVRNTDINKAFLRYILKNSTDHELMAISSFPDGAKQHDPTGFVTDREQARQVTYLLVYYQMAEKWRGNSPATWKNGWTPAKVALRFGIRLDDEETE